MKRVVKEAAAGGGAAEAGTADSTKRVDGSTRWPSGIRWMGNNASATEGTSSLVPSSSPRAVAGRLLAGLLGGSLSLATAPVALLAVSGRRRAEAARGRVRSLAVLAVAAPQSGVSSAHTNEEWLVIADTSICAQGSMEGVGKR